MKYPIRRLLIIAIVTSLWLILAVFGLRKAGLNDQFQAFDHPLVKNDFWLIAWGGDAQSGQSMTRTAFDSATNLHPNIILGAAVQGLKGGELVIAEKHFIYDGEKLSFLQGMSLNQWKSLNPDGLTLEEFIDQFAKHRLYLNLDRLNILNYSVLYNTLAPIKDRKQILIKSSPQGIKKKLKEKQPLWLYSNTTAEIGKLKLMHAMFLEPVISLNADFFVDKGFAPRIVSELRRRFKKAVLQHRPDDTDGLLKAKKYDGVVTTRPSDFISLVD